MSLSAWLDLDRRRQAMSLHGELGGTGVGGSRQADLLAEDEAASGRVDAGRNRPGLAALQKLKRQVSQRWRQTGLPHVVTVGREVDPRYPHAVAGTRD